MNGKKKYLWMNACMHDYVENMVRLKSMMLESRVPTLLGKDYGFNCTCITGSTKFPKSTTTSKYYRVTRLLLIQ